MTIGDYPLYVTRCDYDQKDSATVDSEPFSYSCLILVKTQLDENGNVSSITELGRAICNDICCSDCLIKSSCKDQKLGQSKAIMLYVKDNFPEIYI